MKWLGPVAQTYFRRFSEVEEARALALQEARQVLDALLATFREEASALPGVKRLGEKFDRERPFLDITVTDSLVTRARREHYGLKRAASSQRTSGCQIGITLWGEDDDVSFYTCAYFPISPDRWRPIEAKMTEELIPKLVPGTEIVRVGADRFLNLRTSYVPIASSAFHSDTAIEAVSLLPQTFAVADAWLAEQWVAMFGARGEGD